MVILVTGAAGFVGSHVVEALAAAGHEVRKLDRAPGDHTVADVRDPDAMAAAVRGVDAVCHQAAKVGLGEDIHDIADYVADNDLGTAVLLRALARERFRGRLVLASSMVVYGEGGYRCAEHGRVRPGPRRERDLAAGRFEPPCPICDAPLAPESISEDGALDPRNVYAATKLHQEHLCACFARESGATAVALRYHNVYGPRMPRDTPYAGVAAIFRSALAAGEAPQVFEDGAQRRDFVHVRDVAHANALALTAADPVPAAVNIASGTPRTVGDLAQELHRAVGNGAPAPRVTGRYRLGDVRHVFASADLAALELGFRATVPFAEGIAELTMNSR